MQSQLLKLQAYNMLAVCFCRHMLFSGKLLMHALPHAAAGSAGPPPQLTKALIHW